MKTLTIRLTAPLQAYGNEATFDWRTTDPAPTKSAIIGMVAAALGYQRTDPRIVALNGLSFAVRLDQPGRTLTDYQTVEWKSGTRKITHRDYLQDAVFVVALGSDDEQLIETIQGALRHPRFQLYLGRRPNAPAGVLQMETFAAQSPVEVLEQLSWRAADWYQRRYWRHAESVRVEMIADAGLLPHQHSGLARDRVVSFDQRDRRYGYRAVATETVTLRPTASQQGDTEHDPFSVL